MWLCVNIYTICIYIYKCMYACICVCLHVHVCHAYIVCHEYIDTCIYLFPVHLDIILLVVSDKFSIAAMPWSSSVWAGSPEPPPRVPSAAMFASHAFLPATSDIPLTLGRKNRIFCFVGKKIVTSKRRELTSPLQGDHYRNGKGKGIKGTRRFP